MGPRKVGGGRMGIPGPLQPGQLRALQLPLGFREKESYSRWKISLETRASSTHLPRPSGVTCPLPRHSPILQLCPEPCQAFCTQTGCFLKESAGETGSPAFAYPTFPPKRNVDAQDPRRWMKGSGRWGMSPGHAHGCKVYSCCAGNRHICPC